MFAKFKGGGAAPHVLESNPIWQYYEGSKQTATAGPENVWKIFEGYNKNDGKEVSIFLFDKRSVEKIHKPKRKETITEVLKNGIRQMEQNRHPKILQVVHTVEECPETLAFATEPVLASLGNVLAYEEQKAARFMMCSNPNLPQNSQVHVSSSRTSFVKEYEMLDIEIKYGLLQITEALSFLHVNRHLIHRNVCPSNIIITKKGTWKLAGFEFVENSADDPMELIPLIPWSRSAAKVAQPNLDYIAPEIQLHKNGNVLSDMFGLGLVLCAIFNNGKQLIQSNHNIHEYQKQIEMIDKHVKSLTSGPVPVLLREAVTKLLWKHPSGRPAPQILAFIKYFSDPAVHALQFLDIIKMKEPREKAHFYTSTLKEALPYIDRKLWYQHVWPSLQTEAQSQEVFASVLQPMLYIIQHTSNEEYEHIILPSFKHFFTTPRSTQGTVGLLENLHIILEKTSRKDVRNDILRLLFTSLDSSTIQILTAAFVAVANVVDYLDDMAIRRTVLPKMKVAFEKNSTNLKILMTALISILDRLEKHQIIDDVLPMLYEVKLQEPEIIIRVVNIYRLLLGDKKYGLSVNIMATRVLPSLLPQLVNPNITLDELRVLLQVIQEMLGQIERHQINKLKLDNLSLPSPERHRTLPHQFSTDNMNVPFNIPNLRFGQRKTSSAEDVDKKNSIGSISMTASAENMNTRKNSMSAILGSGFGQWWFGSSTSANESSNFLRVSNTMTNRRLSDNTLMTPKIRVAPSCASSPGCTPGSGLPIRRHSHTGPDRRGSNVNLSPPTGMPITSNSVPYLLSSSMNSIRCSRRQSVSSTSSQQGSSFLQHLGSGMYQLFSGRQ